MITHLVQLGHEIKAVIADRLYLVAQLRQMSDHLPGTGRVAGPFAG